RLYVAQIIRFDRANVVAEAAAQTQRADSDRERGFHGVGAGELSDETGLSAAGDVLGVALGSFPESDAGAVVLSGRSEAGGGKAASASAGGSGDLLVAELAPAGSGCAGALFFCAGAGFFCAVCCADDGTGCSTSSPNLSRN